MSLLESKAFAEHVQATAEKFNVPGIAIACVDLSSGQIDSRAFNHEYDPSVTADSVFSICSQSKLFAVVAYGIMVEEGKAHFDSKLCDLLPDLKLQNSYASDTLTVEEILSHRSGISGHLAVECNKCLTLEDVVPAINSLRFMQEPRKSYQYCNITFGLLGYIVSKLSGMPYQKFVQERILQPLGMDKTSWSAPAQNLDNAQAYVTTWAEDAKRQKVVNPNLGLSDNSIIAPAGAMLSTASDMAKWVAFLLRTAKDEQLPADEDIIGNKTMTIILRSRAIADQQIGAIPVEAGESLWPEMSVPTYGLGQLRAHYRGMLDIASHNGTGIGAGSVMLWTPKRDFGIVVLTNVLGSVFHAAVSIALTAVDLSFGFERMDWNARCAQLEWARNDIAPELFATGSPAPDLKALCGYYWAPAYGGWNVALIDVESTTLDERSRALVDKYNRSVPFGKVVDGRPELLVWPDDAGLSWDIFDLFHINGGHFLGQSFTFAEYGDNLVRIPRSTSVFPKAATTFDFIMPEESADDCKGVRLEYNAKGDRGSGVLGRGRATLVRQRNL